MMRGPDVVWVDSVADGATLLRPSRYSAFTRLPVGRGALDDLVGIVDTNDRLEQQLCCRPFDLGACAKPPTVVHDNLNVLRLLDVFRHGRSHIAVVVDEFGSVEGIVTLTDVLESIAGDFPEMGDEEEEPAVVQRGDGSWLIDGRAQLDELQDQLGLSALAGDGGFHPVPGLVLYRPAPLPPLYGRAAVRERVYPYR